MKFAQIFESEKYGQILARMSYEVGSYLYITALVGENMATIDMQFDDADKLQEAFESTTLEVVESVVDQMVAIQDAGTVPPGERVRILDANEEKSTVH